MTNAHASYTGAAVQLAATSTRSTRGLSGNRPVAGFEESKASFLGVTLTPPGSPLQVAQLITGVPIWDPASAKAESMLSPGDRVTVQHKWMDGSYEAIVLQPPGRKLVWVQHLGGRGGAAEVEILRVTAHVEQIRIMG